MVKVTLRGIVSHLIRLALTVLAVVSAVGFMSATQVLTATISTSFDKVFDDVYKNIDTVVRSANVVESGFGPVRSPVSESVIPALTNVEGVQAVEGQVQAPLAILDKNGEPLGNPNAGPPIFGLNWLTQPDLNGWHLNAGNPPQDDTQVVLDQKTADKGGYAVGQDVKIQVNAGVKTFRVVGTASFGTTADYAGSSAALFETTNAQKLLVEPGKFSWINVAGADGVSQDDLRGRVAAQLPAEAQAITGTAFTTESQDAFRQFFGLLGTVLLVFGLVALFVGVFIIYNTFSIIVAQRTRELALLRAMGAGRGQVLGSVATEALIVGAVASALGLLAGIGLAAGVTSLLASSGSGPEFTGLTYPPVAFLSSFLAGTVVTVGSGLIPAWKAARVPPVAAMRDVEVDTGGRRRPRVIIGGALLLVGLVLLFLGLFGSGGNEGLKVGLAFPAVFIGVAVLGPLFAVPLSRALGAPLRSFNGRLARANAMRNPRRTATTASALMIGVGLVVVFAILIESIKVTAGAAIDSTFGFDLIVDSGSFGGSGIDPAFAPRIEAVPGVATATGILYGIGTLDTEAVGVIGADLGGLAQALQMNVTDGDLATLGPDEVAVAKDDAQDKGWTRGSTLKGTFVNGPRSVTVGAVYDIEAGFGGGTILMTTEGFARNHPASQQVLNQIYVRLDPLTDTAAAKAAMKQLVKTEFPTAKVQDLTEYKDAQTAPLTFLLFIISVMLIIAIFIAVLGIVNTLLLSVYERTREIGLLRAVGMRRGQVRTIIRWESVIFSLQGTVIGAAIGFGFARAIIAAIAQDNPITFAVPWGLLIGMLAMSLVAGVVAALFPAFSASRLNVLAAIATD